VKDVEETVVVLEMGERDDNDIDFEVRLNARDHAIRAIDNFFSCRSLFPCAPL
jgi:hypothetical protein